ncbi:MAG: 16S rRNA (cytidine(1402)-2'-O)-methyltransferase [Flavobacteriaceae bacterium]|nr:16S rRNA (cytidine(1402)-2'-O)-methyltransferase [Flavobacteriaceae bacterium]|tara:strand:+ start:6007 stop:6681 length:675 start_codon:yes stop_codon:yes gene_type:complete
MAKLYVVPTPIGNLDDITIRAIKTLESVDIILCEDTRRSKKLLNHIGVKSNLKSYHKFNEHKELEKVVEKIILGNNVALITDAGTPGISDPGFLIIRTCIAKKIKVECLPGPTALIPGIVLSGLPMEKFIFEGFLPLKKGRSSRLKVLSSENRTMIFYESPHRLIKTLNDFQSTFGAERKISVSRELTKIYEETKRGSLKEIIKIFENKKPKGEFVIVVNGRKN